MRLVLRPLYVDAAAIPCAGLTAFNSLYRRLHCKSGDLVLIHGGSGGVGGFAIQLAKQLGTTVVTTCSAANVDYVRDLGADEVIDHRTENVFERARQIAGPRLFDAIIDTIGVDRRAAAKQISPGALALGRR